MSENEPISSSDRIVNQIFRKHFEEEFPGKHAICDRCHYQDVGARMFGSNACRLGTDAFLTKNFEQRCDGFEPKQRYDGSIPRRL